MEIMNSRKLSEAQFKAFCLLINDEEGRTLARLTLPVVVHLNMNRGLGGLLGVDALGEPPAGEA